MSKETLIMGLRNRGWTIIPGMAIKETFQPSYCKCIATISGDKVTRLYWTPSSVPQDVRKRITGELESILQ